MQPNSPPTQEEALQEEPLQAEARLRQLARQVDGLEARLSRLLDATETSGTHVEALARHFIRDEGGVGEGLAAVRADVEASRALLDDLAGTVTKLSRTQFKANTLTEGQAARIDSALEALREIATRRDEAQAAHLDGDRARLETARREARRDLAADFLPVLDGIERALDNGSALLGRRQREEEPPRERKPFWQRLTSAPADVGDGALAAWLDGLRLVRERMLGLLAAERIERIPTDVAFDPRLHVAARAEARTGVAPGAILDVLRPGYRHGDQVLRYAEVVVTSAEGGDRESEGRVDA